MTGAKTLRCSHPKEKRALLDGYEVVCECGEAVGRVARHGHDVVFGRDEARELLGMLGDAGENSNVRHKLAAVAE